MYHSKEALLGIFRGIERNLGNCNLGEAATDSLVKSRIDLTSLFTHVALGSDEHARYTGVGHGGLMDVSDCLASRLEEWHIQGRME